MLLNADFARRATVHAADLPWSPSPIQGVERRMLAHIGLPWDARCLEFHRTVRPVLTASRWQVRQPIGKGSVGRWRRYERHLGPLREALGDLAHERPRT